MCMRALPGFFLEKKFRGGKAPLTKKVGGGGQMLPKAAMLRSGPVGKSGGISPPENFENFGARRCHLSTFLNKFF